MGAKRIESCTVWYFLSISHSGIVNYGDSDNTEVDDNTAICDDDNGDDDEDDKDEQMTILAGYIKGSTGHLRTAAAQRGATDKFGIVVALA